MPQPHNPDQTPDPELAALVSELGSHTAALGARAAELADDVRNEMADLRSELRGELQHFGRSVRADTLRLQRSLTREVVTNRVSVASRLDRLGARLTALLVVAPLLATAATVSVVLRVS